MYPSTSYNLPKITEATHLNLVKIATVTSSLVTRPRLAPSQNSLVHKVKIFFRLFPECGRLQDLNSRIAPVLVIKGLVKD